MQCADTCAGQSTPPVQRVLSTSSPYSVWPAASAPFPRAETRGSVAPGHQRAHDQIQTLLGLGSKVSHLEIPMAGQLVRSDRHSMGEIWGSGRQDPWVKVGGGTGREETAGSSPGPGCSSKQEVSLQRPPPAEVSVAVSSGS